MAHPIQVILMRQLAGYLNVPVFLVDPKGSLLFYNEPAEAVLGRRFAETGVMPAAEWSSVFTVVDDRGKAMRPEELPLMIALTERRPANKHFTMKGLDGVARHVEVTAIPITGLEGEVLGAVAIFWELAG